MSNFSKSPYSSLNTQMKMSSYTHNPYPSKKSLCRRLLCCRIERLLSRLAQLFFFTAVISLFLTMVGICSLPGSNLTMFQDANNEDINPFPDRNGIGDFLGKSPASAKSILSVMHKQLEQQRYDNEKPIPHPDDQLGELDVGQLEKQRRAALSPIIAKAQQDPPVLANDETGALISEIKLPNNNINNNNADRESDSQIQKPQEAAAQEAADRDQLNVAAAAAVPNSNHNLIAKDPKNRLANSNVENQNDNQNLSPKSTQTFEDYVINQEKILASAQNVLSVADEIEKAKLELQLKGNPAIGNAGSTDVGRLMFKSDMTWDKQPYDRSRGTPVEADVIVKRNFVKEMFKHAWDGYEKYAWAYNELRPVTKKGHSQSIFGDAKTGATIIDAMDTLWLMGFDDEFERARNWVRDEFVFNSKKEVSVFETNIRFIGGLESLFYLTGDEMFIQKAADIANVLLPAFNTKTKLPYALYNPSTAKMKNYNWANAGCSILSEVGTLHLEFGSLSHITHDEKYLDKVMDIRDYLEKKERPANRIWYNYINPTTGAWGSSKAASVGALGDSFYEYLLKTFLITGQTDTVALEMYEDSLIGIKNEILKQDSEGFWYLGEYKRTRLEPKMGHLTCFAGGMFALGSKYVKDKAYWLQMGKEIGETCYQSYNRSPNKIGPETFRFTTSKSKENIKGASKNEKYYILRPEVIETYFYLWRLTKDPKWRTYGWEAAQAINKHCRAEAGFSGLKDVYASPPLKDDLQQSFFFAETLKYLYLLFSDDDLLDLDEWVFNTEAHPLRVIKKPKIGDPVERQKPVPAGGQVKVRKY